MSTTQSTLSRELPLAPVMGHTWQIKIKAQSGEEELCGQRAFSGLNHFYCHDRPVNQEMNSPGPRGTPVGILEEQGSCSSQFHQNRLSKLPQSCRSGSFLVPELSYSPCPHSRSASKGCLISVVKVPRPKYLLGFVTGAVQPCWEENSPSPRGAPAFQTKVIPP